MKVAVWDTYTNRKDGRLMHFDIIVPDGLKDQEIIYGFGRDYLSSKGEETVLLTAKECRFCHIETVDDDWADVIKQQGYYIYEIENCD